MTAFTNPMVHEPVMIDPTVIVGENCTIWQFSTICAEARLGEGVVVGSAAWIGRGAQIGDYTRIQHCVFIPNHTMIGRGCFLGPSVTLTDDSHPKAGRFYRPNPPILEDDCSIGAGAVILPGVRIGRGAMVGAGAVVSNDVVPFATVMGMPARQTSPSLEKEPVWKS